MEKSPLIKNIQTKDDLILEVEFENGVIKIYDCNILLNEFDWYVDLKNNGLFHRAYIDCGGHGIAWNEDIDISEQEIWDNGITKDKEQ